MYKCFSFCNYPTIIKIPSNTITAAYKYLTLFSEFPIFIFDKNLGPINAPTIEPAVKKQTSVRSIFPTKKWAPTAKSVLLKTTKSEVPITIFNGIFKLNKPAKTGAVPLVPNVPVIVPARNPKNELFEFFAKGDNSFCPFPFFSACLLRHAFHAIFKAIAME